MQFINKQKRSAQDKKLKFLFMLHREPIRIYLIGNKVPAEKLNGIVQITNLFYECVQV